MRNFLVKPRILGKNKDSNCKGKSIGWSLFFLVLFSDDAENKIEDCLMSTEKKYKRNKKSHCGMVKKPTV